MEMQSDVFFSECKGGSYDPRLLYMNPMAPWQVMDLWDNGV